MPTPAQALVLRHPEGCAFCPAELLGLERDRNGDPLCQTCPHLRPRCPVCAAGEDCPDSE